jgi:hypothetical protein
MFHPHQDEDERASKEAGTDNAKKNQIISKNTISASAAT